jgi:hypothetical protein
MKLFVGESALSDPGAAVAQAVGKAKQAAEHPIFALVLSTDQYHAPALAAAISKELGQIPWAGCCTAGVFVRNKLLNQGIVVGIISSREVNIGVGIGGPISRDARAAGRLAVAQALKGLSRSQDHGEALILLPDALTGNAAEVVRGAAQEAGAGIVWAGGGAGDNLRFVKTTQFAGGRAYHDHVVAISINTPHRMGVGIRHGWRPYGPPMVVTKATGVIAHEIDYKSAFEIYRSAAASHGEGVTPEGFASFAMTHPLGIPQADGDHVIRDPLSVDPDGSLQCVGEVPRGCLVRVMEGDREALLNAARDAATTAREGVKGSVGGAIVFDCISRSLMLGDGVKDEFATFQQGLGEDVPIMGCLTFGEVGALGMGVPQFHNKTAVVLALPG